MLIRTDTDPTTEPVTKVIYRRWQHEPMDIIALFPDDSDATDPTTCSSYEHVGQHSPADYEKVIRHTWAADTTEPDVAALHAELTKLGYNLRVVKRRTFRRKKQTR